MPSWRKTYWPCCYSLGRALIPTPIQPPSIDVGVVVRTNGGIRPSRAKLQVRQFAQPTIQVRARVLHRRISVFRRWTRDSTECLHE